MKIVFIEPVLEPIVHTEKYMFPIRNIIKRSLTADQAIAVRVRKDLIFQTVPKTQNALVVIEQESKWVLQQGSAPGVNINPSRIEQYYMIYLLSGKSVFYFPTLDMRLIFEKKVATIYTKDNNILLYDRKKNMDVKLAELTGYVIGREQEINQLISTINIYSEKISTFKKYKLDAAIQDQPKLDDFKLKVMSQFYVTIEYTLGSKDIKLKGAQRRKALEYINSNNAALENSGIEVKIHMPDYWQPMNYKMIEIFDVNPTSNEYKKIVTSLKNDVVCNVSRIQRIQNLWIWGHYRTEVQNFKHAKIPLNESYFFHGTRANPPENIYTSQVGLDILFSNAGAWGKGVYLAKNASYSHASYKYIDANSNSQLFYVRAVMGYTIKIGSNPGLNELPINPATGTRYDSLSDLSNPPCIHVLKRSTQSYPEYLITYK